MGWSSGPVLSRSARRLVLVLLLCITACEPGSESDSGQAAEAIDVDYSVSGVFPHVIDQQNLKSASGELEVGSVFASVAGGVVFEGTASDAAYVSLKAGSVTEVASVDTSTGSFSAYVPGIQSGTSGTIEVSSHGPTGGTIESTTFSLQLDPEPSVTTTIRVGDSSGRVVPGAELTLLSSRNPLHVELNGDGEGTVDVAPGAYMARWGAEGHVPMLRFIEVAQGQVVSLELNLLPEATVVGPDGAMLTTPNGHSLEVPAGALDQPTEIWFLDAPLAFDPIGADLHLTEFLPSGLRFADEVTLRWALPGVLPSAEPTVPLRLVDPADGSVRVAQAKAGDGVLELSLSEVPGFDSVISLERVETPTLGRIPITYPLGQFGGCGAKSVAGEVDFRTGSTVETPILPQQATDLWVVTLRAISSAIEEYPTVPVQIPIDYEFPVASGSSRFSALLDVTFENVVTTINLRVNDTVIAELATVKWRRPISAKLRALRIDDDPFGCSTDPEPLAEEPIPFDE